MTNCEKCDTAFDGDGTLCPKCAVDAAQVAHMKELVAEQRAAIDELEALVQEATEDAASEDS